MTKATTLGEFIREVAECDRIRISFDCWIDEDGKYKWSSTLSDAQLIAYQHLPIEAVRLDGNTWYVLLGMETENV